MTVLSVGAELPGDEIAGTAPLLLDAHPLPHLVYDIATLRVLYANPAAAAYYGHGIVQLLGMTRRDLMLKNEWPALEAFMAHHACSAQPPQPNRIWHERHQNGRVLFSEWRGRLCAWRGQTARCAVVLDATERGDRDVAAQRQSSLAAIAGRVAGLGGWYYDAVADRTTWSDEVCAIHELPPGSGAELASGLSHYPGEAGQRLGEAVRRALTQGIAFDLELPFVTAKGRPRWVRVVGEAVRDASGRLLGLQGAQQDITRTKQVEAELRESRTRLAATLRAIPDLWMVFDAEDRYRQVATPDDDRLVLPWSQIKGRRVDEVLAPALGRVMREALADVRRSGQPLSLAYRTATLGGDTRTFDGRFAPLPEGQVLLVARDVTAVQALEQRFRAMADAAPVAIFMTDAAGACTYTNPAWQRLYGCSFEQSLGEGWAAALHPEDRAAVAAHWVRAATAGLSFEMEFRICLPAGEPGGVGLTRTLAVRANPIRDASHVLAGHVGSAVQVAGGPSG